MAGFGGERNLFCNKVRAGRILGRRAPTAAIHPQIMKSLRSALLGLSFAAVFLGLIPALFAQAAVPEKGGEKKQDSAMVPVEDVAGLPRVLIIGDSISIGYTVPTREALKGVGIDDLHAFAASKLAEIQTPKNVHFSGPGSKALAEQVVGSIRQALGK